MEYPWNEFLIEAVVAEDTPPDEETGTNEPVDTSTQDNENVEEDTSQEDTEDFTGDLQAQIDELKSQIEELMKKDDVENEIQRLKTRLDNLNIPDDPDMNDSIFQSASREIKYLKRALRRLGAVKKAELSGEQQELIINELEQRPERSCQEIAQDLAEKINADEQDIFDFIRNTDYRFRHRHRRESSIIDWDFLKS
jgi:hypothetical protein